VLGLPSEVVAALLGVIIGAGCAYLTERSLRRRERRGDTYADAFAVLGAYGNHYLRVANNSTPADADPPVSDIDLHRVEFRVRLDGTTDAFRRYQEAIIAATRFHEAIMRRDRLPGHFVPTDSDDEYAQATANAYGLYDVYQQAVQRFRQQATDDIGFSPWLARRKRRPA
jgi:hypothetical protein